MNLFKDLLRLLALALVVRAVYIDSVACAISAGTLYMGGFDRSLHIRDLVRAKLEGKNKRPESAHEPLLAANVIQLRR